MEPNNQLNVCTTSVTEGEVARLAICFHCILSICNIYLFPALVLRAGFAF